MQLGTNPSYHMVYNHNMLKLRHYLSALPAHEREAFALRCGTSPMYLRNIAYGQRNASAKLAAIIERETRGQLTRKDFFPEDWCIIWPELL